jgi:hypothetical protein
MQEIFGSLTDPQRHPRTTRYLDKRPELKRGLDSIVEAMRVDSHRVIAHMAYLRFKERERMGEQPLYNREWEDWFAAEIALAAYYRYQERIQRGEPPQENKALEDWLAAESAFRNRAA